MYTKFGMWFTPKNETCKIFKMIVDYWFFLSFLAYLFCYTTALILKVFVPW